MTGSRIRSVNLQSAVPVTSLSAATFTNTAQISIGDVLNELPALRSTYSTANSTRFIGTAGLNLLDLRGLGTSRTLVLVNGRRHVSASEGSSEVDTNTIPTDLIDRVDVVTGGNSAIYGSDAIAGVVNFVLKKNFEGLTIRGQEGISDRSDGNAYFVSATAGKNFDGGRGNIAISAEYAKEDPILIVDRPNTKMRGTFTVVEADPPGSPNGAAGGPDRIFVPDTRSTSYSLGGQITASGCTVANAASRPTRCLPNGNPRILRFQPDGTLNEADYGLRDFRPLASSTFGGDGATFRDYGQLDPDIERYSINALGHWDIRSWFKPYFEAKYVHVKAFTESSPTFEAGGGGIDAYLPSLDVGGFSIDNPYLTPAQRTQILTIRPGTTSFFLGRDNLDLGVRNERDIRETYRAVLGATGDLPAGFTYDASVNYGEYKDNQALGNNAQYQRFAFATDAVRDASGNIVCRVTADPTARVAVDPTLQSFLAADVAGCVPINLFGNGRVSQAARDYINTTTKATGYQRQFVANGFVSGDTHSFFNLPAGAIGVSVGGEYRKESAYQKYDDYSQSGATFLNSIATFSPPDIDVKEAFAEVRVPILKDLPFAQEVTLTGAARAANYSGATGTVVAWNAGGTWTPIRDIRFRFNYAESVRAPNQGELYQSATQNFYPIVDPCDAANIGAGTSTRATNCLAAGVPVGFVNTSARNGTQQGVSSGNPNLTAESSRSYTIGAIMQPRFIPGLSVTADYYDITIDNVIASVAPQTAIDNCYDAPSLSNPFCALFQRNPATSEFIPGSLLDSSANFASRRARGIDLDVNYRRRVNDFGFGRLGLGDLGTLNLRAVATYVIQRDNFEFPDNPTRPNQQLLELGDPEWAFNFSADWTIQKLTLSYQLRYIGHQVLNFAEDLYTVGGRPPQNADYAVSQFYPEVYYHAIRATFDITPRYSVYGGVENLADQQPPFGLTGTGAGSGIYDNRGRFFYFGGTAKF